MKVEYILGIDGGGTKTIGRLTHLKSGQSYEYKSGPSSLTNDFEKACITIMQIINQLISQAQCQAGQVCVVMGLAGAGNQTQVARLKKRLALPLAAVEVYNDARTSLYGANLGQPVAMIALGTGSVGGRLDEAGEEHYVGGWGFPIGDEGSGAKLGFMAVKQLLHELDLNHHQLSKLASTLLAELGPDKDALLNWLREAGAPDYAQLSYAIFDLANECNAAKTILAQHSNDVAQLIELACDNKTMPVVLMGGLSEPTLAHLPDNIKALCQKPNGTSLDGACMLAERLFESIEQNKQPANHSLGYLQDKQKTEQLLNQLNMMVSEERNATSYGLDLMSSYDLAQLINQQDKGIPDAIAPCLNDIAAAIDAIVSSFKVGGRLIYVGAGTSGRLGILDAVECPPTFSVDPNQVIGVIAGGHQAIYKAVEGAEDDPQLGRHDLKQLEFNSNDTLVGLAASGRTPYVIGALDYASELGANTISISCNPKSEIQRHANINICPVVGPEVLTGSTRMKSGTAQKLVLNMLSTGAMIRTGKAYQNLMVDVNASNEKLYARAIRIVMQATACDAQTAQTALEQNQFKAKPAILQVLTGLKGEQAQLWLEQNGGFLRQAIEQHNEPSTAC